MLPQYHTVRIAGAQGARRGRRLDRHGSSAVLRTALTTHPSLWGVPPPTTDGDPPSADSPGPFLLVGQASVPAGGAVESAPTRDERARGAPGRRPSLCAQNWQLRPPIGRSQRRCDGCETGRAGAHGRGARGQPLGAEARPDCLIPAESDPKRAETHRNAPKRTANFGRAEAIWRQEPLLCAERPLLCTPESGNPEHRSGFPNALLSLLLRLRQGDRIELLRLRSGLAVEGGVHRLDQVLRQLGVKGRDLGQVL
jgi:hypothetical protein